MPRRVVLPLHPAWTGGATAGPGRPADGTSTVDKIAIGDRGWPTPAAYSGRVEYEEIIRRTVAEIERRLDDPPDFRVLAASAFVSAYHFHRIFHAMVGESPRELARRLRLERTAHRLRDTGSAVVDVAAA